VAAAEGVFEAEVGAGLVERSGLGAEVLCTTGTVITPSSMTTVLDREDEGGVMRAARTLRTGEKTMVGPGGDLVIETGTPGSPLRRSNSWWVCPQSAVQC